MPIVQWSPRLHIGIGQVDQQHEHLTGLINKLYEAHQAGEDRKALEPIVNEINDYAQYHFSEEQKLMEQYGYPSLEDHKALHDDFIVKSVEYLFDYLNGKEEELSLEMLDYLTDWWVNHISKVDQEMGEYLKTKGAS
ncbi:hemerythrin [Oceanidesulfovibrio indonesiensis]|uniref:Hemerythrin n=1 Tax=Oceanidesulfovibrio indonesiensis TaxID=54767 RepID=A0A7M3MJ72_9BACT|nr:bacteriohemerythrin [Oceanidesulfovibrio indonesiensis]TVM19859.1 hemerythrin [Oceanidesulfovibrio indonesiensis]